MAIIDKKLSVKELKKSSGEPRRIFQELKQLSAPTDNFNLQTNYASLFQSLDKVPLALKDLRIAILANNTVTYLSQILEFYMAKEGFKIKVFQSDYGTLEQVVLNAKSDFYHFDPEITFLFTNYRDIKATVDNGASSEEVSKAVEQAVRQFSSLWTAIRKNSHSHIVQNNADIPLARVFGNYEGTAIWSQGNVLRRFNLELANAVVPGVTILDLEYLSALFGKAKWQDMRFWYHAKQPFAFDALGLVAHEMAKVAGSLKGTPKKCIVCDLDNTLWGGVVADDGVNGIVLGYEAQGEAFVDFQKHLLQLKSRGIILAISSKNFEEVAKEPFLHHPDMQLKLTDIMVFQANWDNKADNIRKIAATLEIGLDSIVYLDDNPAERLLVGQMLPEVTIPDLPVDPSEFVSFLSQQSYFETTQFTKEDAQRSEYYLENAKRNQLKNSFENLDEYLTSLDMECTVSDFDEPHMARIVQLINKTNQFNLTTVRYTENEIREKVKNKKVHGRYYKLKDRFGDNGLIAVVILETVDQNLKIDSWLMSCRVLSRGMEEFICEDILSIAKEEGCLKVVGTYIPTGKNKLVVDLFQKLGFAQIQERNESTTWEFSLENSKARNKAFIRRLELSLN